MLAIHTFIPHTFDIRSNTELVSEQALLSCKFLKKHKYTTILYTTQILKDTLFNNHPYDNILVIDDELCHTFSKINFWSGSKLIACELTKEPYFHIDIDLFLIEDIVKSILDQPLFAFHVELWVQTHYNSINKEELIQNYNIDMSSDFVYNCAIFGGKSYLEINKTISTILAKISKENNEIDRLLRSIRRCHNEWKKSVFIEQLLLVNHIRKNMNLDIVPTVIDTSLAKSHHDAFEKIKQSNVLHLWIGKNALDNHLGLSNLIKYIDKYYF